MPFTAAQSVTAGGYADVAPAAFAFLASTDAPVVSASLRVFADADALTDVTDTLVVASSSSLPSLDPASGLVGFRVSGAAPLTTYYARLTLDFGSGPVDFPPATPLAAVQTSRPLAAQETGGMLQFNALGAEAAIASASLSLLSLPSSPWPVSSQTETGLHAFDLNNLKDTNGDTLPVVQGTNVTVEEWLGAACAERPMVARVRRVPEATSGGTLQYAALELCFFADTNCDDTVDVLDLQYLLGFFASDAAGCGFNDDLDVDASGAVDLLDLQALLNRFGDVAPF